MWCAWSGVQACAGRTERTGRQPQRAVSLAKVTTRCCCSHRRHKNARSQSKGRRLGTPAPVVNPLLQQKPWQQPMGKPPGQCTHSCSKAHCNIPLRALTRHAAPSACITAKLRPYPGCELPVLVLALGTEPTDPTASSVRETFPPTNFFPAPDALSPKLSACSHTPHPLPWTPLYVPRSQCRLTLAVHLATSILLTPPASPVSCGLRPRLPHPCRLLAFRYFHTPTHPLPPGTLCPTRPHPCCLPATL